MVMQLTRDEVRTALDKVLHDEESSTSLTETPVKSTADEAGLTGLVAPLTSELNHLLASKAGQ